MLYTTFALAHKSRACIKPYRKIGDALGGIAKYGRDTPIPLTRILEVCGLDDAIWALRCTTTPSAAILIEFICRCAEHVLHLYEAQYPADDRPRRAIDAARVYITNKAAAGAAARAAAGDAARAAAGDAAGDATGAAARDAEADWQIATFRELLEATP